MALWFLPKLPKCTGWHYSFGGPSPKFQGLMIAIDTYKHFGANNIVRNFNQSLVYTINNHTPKHYNYDIEGSDIRKGHCIVDNRYQNTPETVSKIFVRYTGETLTIYHTSNSDDNYLTCMEIREMKFNDQGYMGISASSGFTPGEFNIKSLKFYQPKEIVDKVPHDDGQCPENGLALILYSVSGVALLLLSCFIIAITLWIMERKKQVTADEREYEQYFRNK